MEISQETLQWIREIREKYPLKELPEPVQPHPEFWAHRYRMFGAEEFAGAMQRVYQFFYKKDKSNE